MWCNVVWCGVMCCGVKWCGVLWCAVEGWVGWVGGCVWVDGLGWGRVG